MNVDPNITFWSFVFIVELTITIIGIRWILNKGLPSSYSAFVAADAALYSLGLATIMIMAFLIIVAFVYVTGWVEKYHLVINIITRI